MYYKVIKDNKIIDVLDNLVFLKYQPKHDVMLLSNKLEAQAIFSSDQKHIWHIDSLKELPVNGYDTVEIEQIDIYEYERLKMLNCRTPEEIADEVILSLIQGGIL